VDFTSTFLVVNFLLFVVGVAVLVKGSDWFIDGAAAVAHRFKISEAIVGLTLVSLGTSLPELATNVYCAINVLQGKIAMGNVAMGNIAGSNVANIMLILGLAVTCIGTIPTDRILFYRDTMIMLGITTLFVVLCYFFGDVPEGMGLSGTINRVEGVILLLCTVAYIAYLTKSHRDELVNADHEAAENEVHSSGGILFELLVGGALVVLGSKLMVDNVVWAAHKLEISESVIAATIVAFGTSVPELAVTLAGIVKKKNDIAMGNIIGSNIFNIALVLGISSVIAPVPVGHEAAVLVLPVMFVASALLVLFMRTGWALVRWEGIIFMLGYFAFAIGSFFL
jgi:cation:H+ antiporter